MTTTDIANIAVDNHAFTEVVMTLQRIGYECRLNDEVIKLDGVKMVRAENQEKADLAVLLSKCVMRERPLLAKGDPDAIVEVAIALGDALSGALASIVLRHPDKSEDIINQAFSRIVRGINGIVDKTHEMVDELAERKKG